ncbi:MAG: hypothetical protein K2H19_04125 [Ruminococcus sp.]|nr:hypothetical protein [Ruminococcus sp.]
MKNENIKKINTLGKVSRILLIIMRIALIIGIVGCLVGSVITFTLPKDDLITATGTMSAQVTVDDSAKFFISSDIINIGGIKISNIDELKNCDEEIDIFGTDVKLKINETENNGKKIYDITADLDAKNTKSIIFTIVSACITGAVLCAVMLIAVIFGGKFAKALEICNSPFEEHVLKSMKKFAYSLIPIGCIEILLNGEEIISLTTAFIVIVVLIFAFIFNYGAELQQESDETI